MIHIQVASKGGDFLGFIIRPSFSTIKGKGMLMPATFIPTKSKQSVLQKFMEMTVHKRRKPLKEVARMLTL